MAYFIAKEKKRQRRIAVLHGIAIIVAVSVVFVVLIAGMSWK